MLVSQAVGQKDRGRRPVRQFDSEGRERTMKVCGVSGLPVLLRLGEKLLPIIVFRGRPEDQLHLLSVSLSGERQR